MLPEATFTDRTAIVTGGGTGLGLAIATELGRLGADVIVASRRREHIDHGVEAVTAVGASAIGVEVDIRDPDAVEVALDRGEERWGRPAQLVVNNAAGNFRVPALEMSPRAFKTVVDIVLNGTFHVSRAAAVRLVTADRPGSIVNIGASSAWTGGPGTCHSAAAKAGVLSLTKSLAVEWARRGIRVNAVCPGLIPNPTVLQALFPTENVAAARRRAEETVPIGRAGDARELAWAVAYLLSDYAGFVTGEVLTIDGGGWLRRGPKQERFETIEEQIAYFSRTEAL
jgi:NAD(P)-dependent dehydrogenase (short-subunit alcohol dehydrogenase family)